VVFADLDIGDSIQNFFTELFEWLPRVVGFLLILLIGWFIARLVGRLVTRGLRRVGLDGWLHRGMGGSWIARVIQEPSKLAGTLVFWVVFIAAISIAVDVLGINALEDAIRAVWGYIPNVLAALAIFLIAGAIAGAIVALVNRTMGTTPTGRIVKTVAPTLIMAIAVFMILDQLEIAENIVVITYAALMGAIALGFAVAFGLGGRDVASQMLTSAYQSATNQADQVKRDIQEGKSRAGQQTTDPTIRPGDLPPPPEPV
jgi:Mechanosensitive ion channel, conserved TM helix